MILGGVIYLLSITDKVNSTARKNFGKFHRLCGDKALSKVVLGTTKWREVDEGIGEKREQQLAKTFWSTMTASGSCFDRTERSARAFLNTILDQLEFGKNGEILNDNVLRIQNEIVGLERRISETAASKMIPVMILLMGEVGAGESTFINTVAGKNLAIVGKEGDIYPCTLTVEHFVIQHPKSEVVLVDTPGFNDPTKSDGVILKEIVDWMKNKCPKNIVFGGIIFLHDLSEKREPRGGVGKMTPTKLSDYEALKRVVLAMVNGDSDAAKRRENQLKSSTWQEVQTCQFMNTQESARGILDTILGLDPIKMQDIRDDLEKIGTTQFATRPNRSFFSLLFGSLFSPR